MGYYCTVPQCTSLAGKTKNVKFHRFPRDVTMADKWNIILKRGKPYTKYSKVCSLHFTQGDYNVTTMGQWKTLSKDAVPTQNLPKLNPDGTVMVIRKSRTVKYRESRRAESVDKADKWIMPLHTPVAPSSEALLNGIDTQDSNVAYRLQTLSAIASNLSPQPQANPMPHLKPKKTDAFMQTDPIQSEEDDTQPNNSYSETSENSFNSEQLEQYPVSYKENKDYQVQYQKDTKYDDKNYESPKDYTKQDDYLPQSKDYTKHDDYMPQTNEEYNKEAEKYALERKSHNGYDKASLEYQKQILENGYQKLPDMYFNDKQEYNRSDYVGYQNGYPDSADILRNQQHNIQMLQDQHRIPENQNFFNDNPIKQEVDINDEDKYLYPERTKDQLDPESMYSGQRSVLEQQRLLEQMQHQVKREPDVGGCDNVLQPQGSPYYPTNGHNNLPGGYYEPLSRPGPELLIAKQNALAAHTQLWQNTMKRPFFYSESPHYSAPPLLHRYPEDFSRILQ